MLWRDQHQQWYLQVDLLFLHEECIQREVLEECLLVSMTTSITISQQWKLNITSSLPIAATPLGGGNIHCAHWGTTPVLSYAITVTSSIANPTSHLLQLLHNHCDWKITFSPCIAIIRPESVIIFRKCGCNSSYLMEMLWPAYWWRSTVTFVQ